MNPTDNLQSPAQAKNDNDRTMLRDMPEISGSRVGEALAPNVLKSRFVLEEQLGSGGMGTVYLAKDLRKVEAQDSQPYLAIKVLSGDFRQHPDAFVALQREAAKSQSLSHQNIVKIFDFDKDGDVPFMTMELLRGNELAEMLREYPQGLPESLAWDLIRGFCAALRHAHAEGVIHADLKPGNLFVTHTGQIKIFDFGLARAVQTNLDEGVLGTRSDVEDMIFDAAGLGALTPAFASKAMLQGASPTAVDDLFAAALVIYQILTGKHPYNRVPVDKLDPRSVSLERPRQLSSRQWRALQSALALDHENRLGSVAELEAALFESSPWPMRLLAIGLGTVAVMMWASNLQKDDQMRAVQAQAVQTGRVEAGRDRIIELIQAPTFDEAWEQRIEDELGRLSRLRDSQAIYGKAVAQIGSLYIQRVKDAEDLDAAAALAMRGEAFGDMTAAWQSIAQRESDRLQGLLDSPSLSAEWVGEVETTLLAIQQSAPSRHVAALALRDVNSSYLHNLDEQASSASDEIVAPILATLEDRAFELDRVEAIRNSLRRTAESAVQEMQRDQARFDVANFGTTFVRQGCLVSALPELTAQRRALQTSGESTDSLLAARTDTLIAQCVESLKTVDPDAASKLKLDALNAFGSLPRTEAVLLDPCNREYLIGAGARGVRTGGCSDAIDGAPQLVVVPFGDSALAVTRYEVSAGEYSTYCLATGLKECPAADTALPALNVEADAVEDYADWLSTESGFNYRLPSLTEWQVIARAQGGELDANRNCLVDLGGVARGGEAVRASVGKPNGYGVVNALGNAAEWAWKGETLVSVGGSFNTEIDRCTADYMVNSDGAPAESQGFRLVREITNATRGLER